MSKRFDDALDIERDQMLKRAGVSLLGGLVGHPARAYAWRELDPRETLNMLCYTPTHGVCRVGGFDQETGQVRLLAWDGAWMVGAAAASDVWLLRRKR